MNSLSAVADKRESFYRRSNSATTSFSNYSRVAVRATTAALALLAVIALSVDHAFGKDESIAVLDFEVHDLTMNPAVEQEQQRAATLRPLLQEALAEKHGYNIVEVDVEVQKSSDKGVGYLYDKPALAADLGKDVGADWVIVGRVHKATYLFVYFKALIVDVKSGKLVSEQLIEVKGPQRKFTGKGVEALSILIDRDLRSLIDGS